MVTLCCLCIGIGGGGYSGEDDNLDNPFTMSCHISQNPGSSEVSVTRVDSQ